METYLQEVEQLGYKFSSLLAEALGLGPKGLEDFYDTQLMMQHRGKIVKYPAVTGDNDQGVGPHYDAGFLTFVRVPTISLSSEYTNQFLQASASLASSRFASTKPLWRMDRRSSYSRDVCYQYRQRYESSLMLQIHREPSNGLLFYSFRICYEGCCASDLAPSLIS